MIAKISITFGNGKSLRLGLRSPCVFQPYFVLTWFTIILLEIIMHTLQQCNRTVFQGRVLPYKMMNHRCHKTISLVKTQSVCNTLVRETLLYVTNLQHIHCTSTTLMNHRCHKTISLVKTQSVCNTQVKETLAHMHCTTLMNHRCHKTTSLVKTLCVTPRRKKPYSMSPTCSTCTLYYPDVLQVSQNYIFSKNSVYKPR